ncbi:MAG: hypothetical protein WAN51_09975 [Alphaproteobacteria bacterium]
MSTSAVLDVAIGLVLMYLLLSLACTALNEFIATCAGLRAKTLQNALTQLLDVASLKSDFYNHGLIDGGNAAVNGAHVSYLSSQTFAMALLASLDPTKPLPAFADIESAIKNLPDSNIRDTLLAQLATADGDLSKLRDNVAAWFDHTMDRVSGVYQRYVKWISLGVGLAIALAINADSIAVAKALWHDGTLRAQMVQAAGTTVPATSLGGAGTNTPSVSSVLQTLDDAETKLRPLPIGWDASGPFPGWPFWFIKLGGLLLTALALSLGAPFWFDILSKFMSLRGTGNKPPRTEDS